MSCKPSREFNALSVLALIAIILTGCKATQRGDSSTLRMLPEQERLVVQEFLDTNVPALVSVHYGPEWRTLKIIERVLNDGELIATEHRWSGDGSIASIELYRTAKPRMIRMFYDFRRQIELAPEQSDDYQETDTSNPAWVSHVVPGRAGVTLLFPWSHRSSHWLATAVVLMQDALGDPAEKNNRPVIPAEWWDQSSTPHRLAMGVNIEEVGTFDTWPGLYIHVAISFFDLEQRYIARLGE